MNKEPDICPFAVGDLVRFAPSERTLGHYQEIERFGASVGAVLPIAEIHEGCYLYSARGVGG